MAAPAFGTIGTQLQGSGSTMNVAVPASVAANDIVVVVAFVDTAGATVTALASGFAQAPDSPVTGPDNHKMYVMWKRATGSDTGTYDFTLSGSVYRNAACSRYTGVITSGSPWDVTNGVGSNTSTTTTEDVADTTTEADTLGVWAGTNWSGGTWTPPSGYTERRDTGDGVNSSADKVYASAGSTGAIVGTCTGSDKRCAWFGALRSTGGGAAAGQRTPTVVETDTAVRSSVRRRHTPTTTLVSRAPAVAGPVTGTMAVTQANQTMASSGQLGYSGTSTPTQANQTMAATGTVANPVDGTFARTQADQTMAAMGTVVDQAGVARVVVVDIAAATSLRRRRQAFATFVDLGGAITASDDVAGGLAETQDNQTMSASGTVTISGIAGSLAETQDNQTMAASGTVTPPAVTGTFARTQANQTMSASGTVTGPVTGTFARTQADQTMVASGTITVNTTGTAALAQADQTMTATGVASAPPTGLEPVALFTPPLIEGNPPTTSFGHPGNRLMRNYGNWAQGATVWKDSQGVWHQSSTPYDGGATHAVHNLWVNGVGPTSTYSAADEGLLTAERVYLGGHVHPITATEQAELIAAGYADNITPLP